MRKNRIHILACWLAVFGYVLHVTAASAGFVRCEDGRGKIAIEVGCDHDHCETANVTRVTDGDHGHDHANNSPCTCESCCEDTPVDVNAFSAKRFADNADLLPASMSLPLDYGAQQAALQTRELYPAFFEHPPPFAQTLCALRKTVLLI